ncbi:MAG: hypothetical protein ABIT08_02495 [Bacteroidia bacterium]
MEKKKVADGNVVIRDRSFYYEFWSNNVDITVKIFHYGRKGDNTEFNRHQNKYLKLDMENALLKDGVLK